MHLQGKVGNEVRVDVTCCLMFLIAK